MATNSLLKRALRPLYGPPRTAFWYLRARQINRAYATQYADARQVFAAEGECARPVLSELRDVGVRCLIGPAAESWFMEPEGWRALVDRCATAVADAFARSDNCYFLPPVQTAVPPLTADVPAVRQGEVISLQLRNATGMPEVAALAAAALPQIEERVFGSFVVVDKVYVYRNLVSRQAEQVSWLWHYDNHPTQILKLMVYLTDVDEGRAPLEYVRHQSSHAPLVFDPLPLMGSSRVPRDRVDALFADGYAPHKAVGPAGTSLLFDDNVLHRATLARTAHRDVLVLQLRPAAFRPEPRLDPRWTGSFSHDDFNQDPAQYAPHPKRRMLSA